MAGASDFDPHLVDWRVAAIVLTLFTATFLALGVGAYTQTSATWDEPIHLTAGHAAVSRQDFRIEPAHPPLFRMWAALPNLVLGGVSIETDRVDSVLPGRWLQEAYLFAHEFLYVAHDADRLLYRARFMILLLGVGLGWLLFRWTHEWLGLWPAVLALIVYTLEPNLLSHASLVTTDFGVTGFVFGAVYFLWRLHRGGGWASVTGVTVCCALAVTGKFSGLLLAPIVIALLAASVMRSRVELRRAVIAAGLVAAGSFVAIWAVYGFRYLPSASGTWTFALHGTSMADSAPVAAAVTSWIDSHRLLPNAFTQGVFYAHASVTQMPAFLAGEIREGGWWYYFPAVFLLKMPLAVLFLLAVGIVALIRRRRETDPLNVLFIVVPIVTYLGAAMASGVNIGLRHILPIYPFLLLIVAAGAWEFLRTRRPVEIATLGLLILAASLELWTAYPHTLTFFNQAAGGPEGGYRYLADSNLGWGQSLKGLKAWMDRNGVTHVNLAYFGQADPAYYGIDCTHLPGAPSFAIDAIARPRLPGYVAISSTTLSGVYASPEWRLFYRPFVDLEPVAVIGNSLRVYWIDEWPDLTATVTNDRNRLAHHRRLADALLFGLQWPEAAARVYAAYLRYRPSDTDGRVNYGIALVASDRIGEGLEAFKYAATDDVTHGRAQLMLARALFSSGDLAGAAQYIERAVALAPDDADVYHLLGRVRAAQGDLSAARSAFARAVVIAPRHEQAQRDLQRVQSGVSGAPDPALNATP